MNVRHKHRMPVIEDYGDEKGHYFLEVVLNEHVSASNYLSHTKTTFRVMSFALLMACYFTIAFVVPSQGGASAISIDTLLALTIVQLAAALVITLMWVLTERDCTGRMASISRLLMDEERDGRNAEWVDDYIRLRHVESTVLSRVLSRYLKLEPFFFFALNGLSISAAILALRA